MPNLMMSYTASNLPRRMLNAYHRERVSESSVS
jgi:hypothetical protein